MTSLNPSQWKEQPDGGIQAQCPKCFKFSPITSPVIQHKGQEAPSLVCVNPECDFQDYVLLEGHRF